MPADCPLLHTLNCHFVSSIKVFRGFQHITHFYLD
nr:MAG TPA: hypothetical protein [Caudoviricetes sp.]